MNKAITGHANVRMDKPVFQNKFGFYPASYETYKKLKRLNFIREVALHQDAKYKRFLKKKPHNRVFKHKIHTNSADGFKHTTVVKILLQEPFPPIYIHPIFNYNYTLARYPKKTRDEVVSLTVPLELIDQSLEKAEKWYSQLISSRNHS